MPVIFSTVVIPAFPFSVCLAFILIKPSCLSRVGKIREHNAVAYPSRIFPKISQADFPLDIQPVLMSKGIAGLNGSGKEEYQPVKNIRSREVLQR